jgi:hypothetical protein
VRRYPANEIPFIICSPMIIFIKPLKQNLGELKDGIESLGTIITVLLATTTFCF